MNRQQRRAAAKQGITAGLGAAATMGTSSTKMFEAALGYYSSGHFAEAEQLSRQILSIYPNHARSIHLIGLLEHHQGHPEIALKRIGEAIALNDRVPEFHHNFGNVLREAGRLEEAAIAYQRALALKPDSVDTLYNLGNVSQDIGRPDQAVAYFERALALRPSSVEILNNLGTAFHDQGMLDQAAATYQRALSLRPDSVETLTNYAGALRDQGEMDRAVAQYEWVLALRPDHVEARNGLGITLREQGKVDAAIAHFERALALAPDQAETHNNLAMALEHLGKLDEAVAHYEHSLRLGPNQAETHNNLGNALEHQGRLDEAMTSYEQALALKPDYPEVHYNRGLLLLLRGEYAHGWTEYEWRWRCKDNPEKREFRCPQWSGEPLGGRTVLLHAEQGFGDVIQFLRYVPAVAQLGENVLLAVPRPLVRIADNLPGVAAVFSHGDPVSESELHCPLLSLPLAFGTRLETIPNSVPYLAPPPDVSAAWARRFSGCAALKVGLVWSGNPANRLNTTRSIPLPMLEILWGIAGVRWFSLQVGGQAGDIALASKQTIDDLSPFLTDFAETAAAICHLDLVISVETAVAHLAGALGRPVWVPLAFVPAWRWLLDREDSPWYPTMRLFRQTTPGDWAPVVGALADALAKMADDRAVTG
jgi:tetratricopeptide (TPR) repeat protein